MTKRNHYNKVEDFLRDDEFICYALEGNTDSVALWDSYANNPCNTIRCAFQKAVHILQNLDDCSLLSDEEVKALKVRIFKTLKYNYN